jgi:putative restriction endonuclease
MFDRAHDARVRTAAFEWLTDQVMRYGDVLPRALLAQGFILDDIRVPLVGPQGIFKPRILEEVPLSITTAPDGPYDDAFGKDGFLRYRYRGIDPGHRDNRGLRTAMTNRLPLIYFHGIAQGRYVAAWPVFVIGDDPTPPAPAFSIVVDDKGHLGINSDLGNRRTAVREDADSGRRAYITSTVQVRLHQRAFRERVLDAYRRQCAFCRLRHEELLDAAHIIPDSEPEGEPVVRNGLALCNLHHAAFDKLFVGLRPDYIIEIRPDILREGDGPTLRHAIQGLHGIRIQLPHRLELRPDMGLLSQRYALFQEATVKFGPR